MKNQCPHCEEPLIDDGIISIMAEANIVKAYDLLIKKTTDGQKYVEYERASEDDGFLDASNTTFFCISCNGKLDITEDDIIKLEAEAGKFELAPIENIGNEDEARQLAIDWQNWFSEVSLSYGELAEYQEYFTKLAEKFGLLAEFKENGII